MSLVPPIKPSEYKATQQSSQLERVDIDLKNRIVTIHSDQGQCQYEIDSAEGFAAIGQVWLRAGWEAKYSYGFTWMGRPIIQLPEDALRIQEIIYRVKPDVIIETGIAHGGSLVFYASLCRALGKGKVVGVEKELRAPSRAALEQHELSSLIELIDGDSIAPDTLAQVTSKLKANDRVLIVLDSCHSKSHVLKELELYSSLVTPGSYIIAMDGVMESLHQSPSAQPDWAWNNPTAAAAEFVLNNADFVVEAPSFVFNEGRVKDWLTYSPGGIIKRLR